MAIYKKILVVNIFLFLIGFLIFRSIYNPLQKTNPEEIENETNPLRLAQLRVDFPIQAIHDPQARLVGIHYPKTRHFADQVIGVGLLYDYLGKKILLQQVYRDLNPLTHGYEDYVNINKNGQALKVAENLGEGKSAVIWFYDVGVYELKGEVSREELIKLFENITPFTGQDEKIADGITNILEGRTLQL